MAGRDPARPTMPPIDEQLTIAPLPCFRICESSRRLSAHRFCRALVRANPAGNYPKTAGSWLLPRWRLTLLAGVLCSLARGFERSGSLHKLGARFRLHDALRRLAEDWFFRAPRMTHRPARNSAASCNDVARATSENDFRSADVLGIKARSA
jgi:hypothetical protein